MSTYRLSIGVNVDVTSRAYLENDDATSVRVGIETSSWLTYGGGWLYSNGIQGVGTIKGSNRGSKRVIANKSYAYSGSTYKQWWWIDITKTHSPQTISWGMDLYNAVDGYTQYLLGSQSGSITIGAKTSYNVTYNANGGSNAPSAQTKWYGEALTLSKNIPTRTNYDFLGWSTNANATEPTYKSGASYTANSSLTLYAVWKLAYVPPSISSLTCTRYEDDENARISFSYTADNILKSDNVIKSASVRIREESSSTWLTLVTWTPNSRTGSLSFSDFKSKMGALNSDLTYDIEVRITDNADTNLSTTIKTTQLPATTVTDNMRVKLIKNKDYASPVKINEGITILDKLGVDYIVSEHIPSGTENPNNLNWWWRIWKSGKIECGIDRVYLGAQDLSAGEAYMEGLYQTGQISLGDYPSAVSFLDTPYVTIMFQYDDTLTTGRNCWVALSGDGTRTTPPSFRIVDHSNNAIHPYVGIHVIGRSR